MQVELYGSAGNFGGHPFESGKEAFEQFVELQPNLMLLDLVEDQREIPAVGKEAVFGKVCWLRQT